MFRLWKAETPQGSRLFAFTVIELLMVIAMIGVLATVGISQFTNFTQDAKIAVTRERLEQIRVALVGDARMVANGQFVRPGYEAHLGAMPGTLDDLVTQGTQVSYSPVTKTGWRGPYLAAPDSTWKQDAWGHNFVFDSSGRTITSGGPDEDVSTTSDNLSVTF